MSSKTIAVDTRVYEKLSGVKREGESFSKAINRLIDQVGAAVSHERLAESLAFLRLFRVGDVDVETAHRYATIVADLRHGSGLAGRSKPDLWIAAWAVQHAAPLVTRNTKHFKGIPDLELTDYSMS